METGADELDKYRKHLRERLEAGFTRGGDPHKRFARIGLTQEIFDEGRLIKLTRLVLCGQAEHGSRDVRQLQSITHRIRGFNHRPAFCNVLAILLYIRAHAETLERILKQIADGTSSALFSDIDLPVERDTALGVLGKEDGQDFFNGQFSFCPVVLKEGDESVYVGHRKSCPLPFCEEPTDVGEGTYAKVSKVIIEKGHFNNLEPRQCARKKYLRYNPEEKASFETEGTTIRNIIQSAGKNENILTTLGSLEWHDTYSLFFDLARSNLWEYFNNPTELITDLDQKKYIFGQTIGLAGALAHLHNNIFDKSNGDQLVCYHLDLKPENILVFDGSEGMIWKISDFGISKIKRVKPPRQDALQSEHSTSVLDRIFQPKKPSNDPSSGVQNSRYGWTYAAPEAKELTHQVTRACDVWSLGCIVALTLTFLEGGSASIKEFESARVKGRDNDRFFDSTPIHYKNDVGVTLHNSVPTWLDSLVDKAYVRSEREGISDVHAIKRVSKLLTEHILLPNHEKRIPAAKVEKELRSIQPYYTYTNSSPSGTREAINHQTRKTGLHQYLSLRIAKNKNKVIQSDVKPSSPWPFGCSSAPKQCKLSFNGKYLAVVSSESIATILVGEIQNGRGSGGPQHDPPSDASWANVSLGSDYLCATVDSHSPFFRCSYIPLSNEFQPKESNEEPSVRFDVFAEVDSQIRTAIISPNDQATAFVLEESLGANRALTLALCDTQDIKSWMMQSGPRSSSPNISAPSRSSEASKAWKLPWSCKIKLYNERQLPSGLVDLKFSNDSSMLIGVTKSYKHESGQEYRYEVIFWDVMKGRRLSQVVHATQGSDYMRGSWMVGAFAVFTDRACFAAISSKKISLGSYDPDNDPQREAQSQATGDKLLDVLIHPNQKELVVIGQSHGRGKIKIFRIPTNRISGLDRLGIGISTGLDRYKPITDSICLVTNVENGQISILIASIDSRHKEGKLYQIVLG